MSLPEGWRETTLGEEVQYVNKKTSIENIDIYNYISTENLIANIGGVEDASTLPNIPKVNSYQIGDVLFSNIRTYFKKVWLSNKVGGASGDVLIFRPLNKNINNVFIYYLLCSNNFIDYTVLTAKGTKMPRGDKDAIKLYEINLPPLQEQKAIASILSSFDEKIELLKEQNETLEQMAQRVFRESLNKYNNSNETTLGGLVKIKYGKDHKHLEDGKYPLYGSGGVMRYVEKTLYEKESILIPRKGTLSNLFFIQEPFWSVDTIFYTEIDDTLVSPIYLFYKLKRINLANLNVGSAVPSLTTNVLNALELDVPIREEQEETVELLTSFNEKKLYNISQIKTLSKIRDTLLPKLMSGEVRVDNF